MPRGIQRCRKVGRGEMKHEGFQTAKCLPRCEIVAMVKGNISLVENRKRWQHVRSCLSCLRKWAQQSYMNLEEADSRLVREEVMRSQQSLPPKWTLLGEALVHHWVFPDPEWTTPEELKHEPPIPLGLDNYSQTEREIILFIYLIASGTIKVEAKLSR